ncbi:hypothetical protein [Prosthecobacter sp.]|uniref:hypothetical protein n=1 Tax=Prosthecobacter sp. TaxID=1965333 RepID=UPI002AB9C5C0|nr:hypothetical protein [Prosthecobacter sp.]MDZ4405113.1 hypothetical protein [Prosthecobacter sp.]
MHFIQLLQLRVLRKIFIGTIFSLGLGSFLVGCRPKDNPDSSATDHAKKASITKAPRNDARENLLAKAVGAVPILSSKEKSALKRFADGNRKFIVKKDIIGIEPEGKIIWASFDKHELPEILKETSPSNQVEVEKIARTTLQAVLYAYKIHRKEIKHEAWKEDPILHALLRFEPGIASQHTPFILEHMLMVIDDLDEICR